MTKAFYITAAGLGQKRQRKRKQKERILLPQKNLPKQVETIFLKN